MGCSPGVMNMAFDHQQVVVERDHCVEQGDEKPADEILLESGREDEELRKKPAKGGMPASEKSERVISTASLGVGAEKLLCPRCKLSRPYVVRRPKRRKIDRL